MTASERPAETGVLSAAAPLVFLLGLILYGLIWRPLFAQTTPLPLEAIFGASAVFALAQLLIAGRSWREIEESIVRKLSRAVPAFFILFAIGAIVGSWMVSGTLPMLVSWGLAILNPDYIYLAAFLVPALFSTLTGTSWGSAGTIGVVIIGMATAVEADLGITAGAVIGGAFFGDKLSPLSDTTNIAALAAEVDLYDHIRAMIVTTGPAALLAAAVYAVLGFTHPAQATEAGGGSQSAGLVAALEQMFVFHPLLALPPLIVLYGSLRRYPPIPTLLAAIAAAFVLAVGFQRFDLAATAAALVTGFDASMASWVTEVPDAAAELVNRGGLYSMREAVFIAFLVFFFIGIIDVVDAMPRVVDRLFGFATGQRAVVLAALGATGLTNAMTSNQYATSFIVGDAFRRRFDQLGLSRRVLSRSLEDYGTMIESLTPWHATSVFMVAALGVPWSEHAPWQVLSIANIVIAPLFAVLGVGLFRNQPR